MKAIKILDKLMRAENWDDYYPSKNQCNEAIKELEDLEVNNKELKDLQSRSCENCYESKTCKILHSVYKDRLKKEGYAMHKNEFKCGFWHSLF